MIMWAVKKLERHRSISKISSSSLSSRPSSSSSSPRHHTPCSPSSKLFLLAAFICLSHLISPCLSRACGKDDWMYSYTECDSRGQRWRVAIPKEPDSNPCEILKTPVAGKSCSFSCAAGKYMAVQGDQECHGKSRFWSPTDEMYSILYTSPPE